jgi:hypothetical protein
MTDPVDQLAAAVIRSLDIALGKSGSRNVSYPFGKELTRDIIKAVTAKVVAHYQPLGVVCRLDFSTISVGVQARLRATKAPR